MTGRRRPTRPDVVSSATNLRNAFGGAVGGALATPSPINGRVDKSTVGLSSEPAIGYKHDVFPVTAAGAKSCTLTFIPIDEIEHVYLLHDVGDGIHQRHDLRWTRATDSKVVVVNASADLQPGDTVVVEYAYYMNQPYTECPTWVVPEVDLISWQPSEDSIDLVWSISDPTPYKEHTGSHFFHRVNDAIGMQFWLLYPKPDPYNPPLLRPDDWPMTTVTLRARTISLDASRTLGTPFDVTTFTFSVPEWDECYYWNMHSLSDGSMVMFIEFDDEQTDMMLHIGSDGSVLDQINMYGDFYALTATEFDRNRTLSSIVMDDILYIKSLDMINDKSVLQVWSFAGGITFEGNQEIYPVRTSPYVTYGEWMTFNDTHMHLLSGTGTYVSMARSGIWLDPPSTASDLTAPARFGGKKYITQYDAVMVASPSTVNGSWYIIGYVENEGPPGPIAYNTTLTERPSCALLSSTGSTLTVEEICPWGDEGGDVGFWENGGSESDPDNGGYYLYVLAYYTPNWPIHMGVTANGTPFVVYPRSRLVDDFDADGEIAIHVFSKDMTHVITTCSVTYTNEYEVDGLQAPRPGLNGWVGYWPQLCAVGGTSGISLSIMHGDWYDSAVPYPRGYDAYESKKAFIEFFDVACAIEQSG